MNGPLLPRPEMRWSAALRWARSGAMGLGGGTDGSPPPLPPTGFVERLDLLVDAIEQRTARGGRAVRVSWDAALAGRAGLLGLHGQGRISANGSCRLLEARDGWVSLNLPRTDDLDLIPALVGGSVSDPWHGAADLATRTPASVFVERARLLGMGASELSDPAVTRTADLVRTEARWSSRAPRPVHRLRVVDLSPLWAGPVVARVLAESGACVTRIVSTSRHEGAVAGSVFYRWIHSDDEVRAELDLRTASGRRQAAELIEEADVVIEGSRPRALEQLGLGPDATPDRPGRVWLSITGYGRGAPGREWVAFGDDAAVAGGLVGRDPTGRPVFCGDAIADPLTGLIGAAAVLRALEAGGGQLIDLAMSRAACFMSRRGTGPPDPEGSVTVEPDGRDGWVIRSDDRTEPVRDRPPTTQWISRVHAGHRCPQPGMAI